MVRRPQAAVGAVPEGDATMSSPIVFRRLPDGRWMHESRFHHEGPCGCPCHADGDENPCGKECARP